MAQVVLLLILLFASIVEAQDFGCGRDTDQNGTTDTFCPGSDADADGFTVSQGDCDDNNFDIFPGVSTGTGCSAGQWRTCKLDGTGYTACTSATFCPNTADTKAWNHTGTITQCRYFNPSTGSNSTGDGTAGNPWEDLREISSGYAGGVSVTAGTAYILRGGTYTGTYNNNGDDRHAYLRNRSCTATNPCYIMCYPGETCNFDFTSVTPQRRVINLEGAQHWYVEGLRAIAETGALIWAGSGAANPIVYGRRNFANGVKGLAGNNIAALYCSDSDCYFSHNVIKGVLDSGGNHLNENVAGIVFFKGNGTAIYNILDMGTTTGSGIKSGKHSLYDSIFLTYGNYIRGTVRGVYGSGRTSSWKNNLVVGAQNTCVSYKDAGGPSFFGEFAVEYNTCVDSSIFLDPDKAWNTDGSSAADSCSGNYASTINVNRNIVTSTRASHNQDSRMFGISTYGSKPNRDTYIVADLINSSNNVFYSSTGQTVLFGEYEANDANTACGGRAEGGNYTLASFQSLGVDTGSVLANPSLNSSTYLPSASYESYGYRASWPTIGTEGAPTPTPSPTPTASPSPSPTPAPTPVISAPSNNNRGSAGSAFFRKVN